ncbi:MAG: hypothetical protein IKQ22_01000 [Clostridia bacterium]|nr:hypothetical protein [Clostridia bacterium]
MADDTPKIMTNALLAEHGLKQAKIISTLLKKCLQVIGEETEPDLENALKNALQEADTIIKWYESGEGLKAFQQSDPDDEGEDYDTYAPEIYAMNSIDPSILEDTPEYQAGLKEAMQKRKAALLRASGMLPPLMNNPKVNSILGEWEIEKEPEKSMSSPEQIQDLEKEMGIEGKENEPVKKDTSVPEQMADLIAALKDDPHDDRWED